MGFLKDLGEFAGKVTGTVIGGSVRVVGEVTGSQFIKEIGDGVQRATENTGKLVGELASGTVDVVAGLVTNDEKKIDGGLKDVGGAVVKTATGIGHGVVHIIESGKDVYEGLSQNNSEQLKQGAKNLVKIAAVGALAIGIVDVVDGVDGVEATADGTDLQVADAAPTDAAIHGVNDSASIENPNMHHVTPHVRHLADGQEIWVDGDGDSSVNTYGGWDQHNPDYKVKG